MEDEYFCETTGIKKEYYLTCPLYYHIKIEYAYFGRYEKDTEHCTVNTDGEKVPKDKLVNSHNEEGGCGAELTNAVSEYCDGQPSCRLVPSNSEFRAPCMSDELYRYMHIKYHCEKDKEIKTPKFAVVMFANIIKPNTIYENSISEFYQYADVHGYHFYLNTKRYDNERSIYYMKFDTILEAMLYGLKTKAYDWIFWADSDTVLGNPNVKLEVFVPEDSNIHYLVGVDGVGLNNGLFLMRVHSWSLNLLMRAMAYQYYHRDRNVYYSDQASINNVLIDDHEEDHYIIIPRDWINKYNDLQPGDFIFHYPGGRSNKTGMGKKQRERAYSDKDWNKNRTNKQIREEVLKYYRQYKDNKVTLKLQG